MTHSVFTKIRSFFRKEDGTVTTAFAMMVPFYLGVFMASAELGMMTLRYAYLERSLDVVVRDIRLSTGYTPSHDELVQQICDEASIIPNCTTKLRLEMVQRDPRNWTALPEESDCRNTTEPMAPVVQFTDGDANDMMVLRACAKINPVFPAGLFRPFVVADTNGDYALVVTNAFVQEPR